MIITKRPFAIPEHKYWAVVEDKYLIDYSEEFAADVAEAYKKGHIDGSIEVTNGTCSICGSYPMTANCNNANCDK